MLIQVDVDSTLYDAHSLFAQIAKEDFDVKLPKNPSNWHDYTEVTDSATLSKIFRRAHSREYVEQQIPYKGAVDVLDALYDKNHTIVYISDRHGQSVTALFDWLSKHRFPIPGNLKASKDKREWMFENKPSLVIDDRPRTLFYGMSLGATGVTLEHPWNVNLKKEIEGIIVCKDWNEIYSALSNIL